MKRTIRLAATVLCSQALILGHANCSFSADTKTPKENLQQLIISRTCSGCNLSGLNLNKLDLSGVDLEGANLTNCKLYLTNLSGANLKNAKLNGAQFGGADLGGADLRGADLEGTSMSSAYLGEALLDDQLKTQLVKEGSITSTEQKADTPISPTAAPTASTIPMAETKTITKAEDTSSDSWWARQPKEKKMLYTNLTAATAIGIWGLATWDYGSAGFQKAHEGWFEKDSKYGGADKLGHLWSTYTFADALTGLYKGWGYESEKANAYAALSSWTVQLFMEIGDGTSETQGFSWEDMVMNTLGSLTSVLMERYPELDRKIDLRVEYVFNVPINGIFDDYSNQYYSLVLKLDGFDSIQNTFAKYIEFSGGYYTRGYEDKQEDNDRSLFVGISFNFSRLLNENGWQKTGKILEYIQPPYTVAKVPYHLD